MVTEVYQDIYRIEVPLPQNPMKLLNSYFIRGNERNLIIDTGFNRPECKEALLGGLKELGADYSKTDIFITHLHADHSGLVSSIRTEDNTVYASRQDGHVINSLHADEYWVTLYEQFRITGLRLTEQLAIDTHPGYCFRPDDKKVPMHCVADGDVLHVGDYELTCVHTPGHSPGHMCLYDKNKKIFFAGDMILGDITPNLCPERFALSSLTQYLQSLDKVEALDIEHVFVGHRSMLTDLQARIDSLRIHHRDRCAEALQVLEQGPLDAWEAAAQMTWQINAKNWDAFPPSQKWFATGEAYEHMLHLCEQGKVLRHYRPNGVEEFQLADIQGIVE